MRNGISSRRKRSHLFSTAAMIFLCSTSFILLSSPKWGFGQVPIQEDIKEAVAFLFPHSGEKIGIGTGFFLTHRKGTGYLVTAKHVLMADSKNYYPKVCIKINNTKGGADLLPIVLSGPNAARVFVHSTDPDVDIAVIPLRDIPMLPGRSKDHYHGISLGFSLLATKDHFAKGFIKEGDETFFVGWFLGYHGIKKNYPIVRFGRVALLTNEKIPWRDKQGTKMRNLYLIETHASIGVSGSPVFFRPSPWREPRILRTDTPTLLLAGVLTGYFADEASKNSGIAAVVPASQLQEIILSDEVKDSLASGKKVSSLQINDIVRCREVDRLIRESLNRVR